MKAWCGQGLMEHLENTAKIAALDSEMLDRVSRAVDERLGRKLLLDVLRREVLSVRARLGTVLPCGDLAGRLATYAAYVHDVGKALNVYQERLKRAEGDAERCRASTRGHELWSAWTTRHVLSAALRTSGTCMDRSHVAVAVATAAVALHHAARRSMDEAMADAEAVWPQWADIEAMAEIAAMGLKYLGLNVDVLDVALAAMRSEWLRYEALWRLREFLIGVPESVYGELLVHVVAIADNLDSAVGRLGEARVASILEPLLGRKYH